MRYINVIEELSESKFLHQGDIQNFAKEVLKTAANTLKCQRANAWLFNKNKSVMRSIQSYNSSTDQFQEEPALKRVDLPNYFNFLTRNRIIVSDDAVSEEMNKELVVTYLLPNRIRSMIDVPLRSEGEMVGVICFETVDHSYSWTNSDQKFAQSLAQLLSIAIETNQKNLYRKELEKTIQQKEVLLHEINHRVKNNMAVIIGLTNLQKHKSKDDFHVRIFEELKEKIHSMAIVQNHLHNYGNLVKVELARYLEELIANLHGSYGHGKDIKLQLDLEKAVVDITKGIPIGLISNEVLTNSFKYAFDDQNKENRIAIQLKRSSGKVILSFKDNGSAFDPKKMEEGMGMELIRELTKQIDGEFQLKINGGVEVRIEFPL